MDRVETLEQVTAAREMPAEQETRDRTVLRRQKRIANARADRAEKAALRSYFQQQGMTEQQVNQAIADYKEQQKKNQPNVTQLQQDLENSRNEVQQMKNEKFLSGKGVKADDLDYVTYKVSKLVDDNTTFEKAAEKFLKENPRFAGGGSYRIARFFSR